MKKRRLEKILDLITKIDISTQEELQELLRRMGFNVTQATVSRDIKELKLVKITCENGGYKYALPVISDTQQKRIEKLNTIFIGSVISVDYAVNMVVIKCDVGMAQAACASFDSMEYPNVVGSLAGDDTIFIVMRNERNAEELCETLKNILNEQVK